MRVRTWLSRASFVGAALLLVLALVSPALVEADENPRPSAFEAGGFATPIQLLLNTQPQTFVEELVRVNIPHGSSQMAAGGQARSRASSAFPGAATEEGPNLAWGMFWGQFCGPEAFPCADFPAPLPPMESLPPWPFSAQAEHPTNPEATPTFEQQQVGEPGDPVSFTISDVVATATADSATSTAVISNLDLLPVLGDDAASGDGGGTPDALPLSEGDTASSGAMPAAANPSLLHARELSATTSLAFDGGVLVAESESRIKGMSLFGGAIEIDTIVARSVSRADGDGLAESDPSVTVAGVTVGGTPARITDEGLVLGGDECPVDLPELGPQCGLPATVAEGINTLFGANSASVRLIDVEDENTDGTARGDAVALAVEFAIPASGFPAGVDLVGNMMIGTASSNAFANFIELGGIDPAFDFTPTDPGFGFDPGFTPAPPVAPSATGTGFATVAGESVAAPPAPQPTPAARPAQRSTEPRFAPIELLSGLAASRVELLYGAWALTMLGLALASRLKPFRLSVSR